MSKYLTIPPLLLLLLLAPGCKVDLQRPSHRDACAACADGPARCPEAGSCKDTGPCFDLKPSPDTLEVKTLMDDTFDQLSKGTLSESGAKIYVARDPQKAADGSVRLLDLLDLDGDGYLDLIFSNYHTKVNSYIYWGAPKGFSKGNRAELPAPNAMGVTVADLNSDGYPDVIFSIYKNPTHKTNSYIYWGSSKGFSSGNRAGLPTMGASGSSVADLDRDGYLDIVFSNGTDGDKYQVDSYVYWGSVGGFSASKRTELPTSHTGTSSVADLDRDGYLDIVFSNLQGDKASQIVNSYIYWGSSKGFSSGDRAELPTLGAMGSTVADLNKDGLLDVAFSNWTGSTSYIYRGTAKGFSSGERAELPTLMAQSVSVGDINGDGHLDIVFSNYREQWVTKTNSYLYWGSSKEFSKANRLLLPTLGARGNVVADFNSDGYLDVVFSNYTDTTRSKSNINSYIYWGGSAGPSSTNRTELPTVVAMTSMTTDPGSVYDRRPVQTFTSRVLDAGTGAPTYLSISWKATVPKLTSLKLQVRSASSPLALKTAAWHGPTSAKAFYVKPGPINPAHKGDRYIQYRATFSHDFGSTPVLDRVQISYHP